MACIKQSATIESPLTTEAGAVVHMTAAFSRILLHLVIYDYARIPR